MADGYRFPQQSAGSYYYPQHSQHHPRHLVRSGSPSNNIRSGFNTDPPSPSRSPDNSSPSNVYGMFGQSQQQTQHSRVNGGPGGRGIPLMYNFQHQSTHQQQQQHTQHHQSLQQDHAANGTALGHHTSYSSGILSNSTPNYPSNSLPNGHSATTRGGQAQMINEHWADQLKLHEETKRAHTEMRVDHRPNYYARVKGQESRPPNLASEISNLTVNSPPEGESEDRGRMSNEAGVVKRQDWLSLDMSGQGLKVLTTPIFRYTFLNELYIGSNNLTQLPPAIGQLRHLRHLDVSYNMLDSLPPELGMCVYLKQLLLFNNKIQTLPNELGSLYQLEMLGIEGNPMNQSLGPKQKETVMTQGTKAAIQDLREGAPPPFPPTPRTLLSLGDNGSTSSTQEQLKVFSYNTLCDHYATTKQYGYTPTQALAWDYRKDVILDEIKNSEADFLCLQEIEQESYNEFFRGELAYFDYKGVFWPNTRARTMSEKDAKKVDGCATFYKDNKYILLDKQLIDFANIAINRPDMKNQHDIFNRVMPRDHVAVVTFFENRLTGARFIVVNAHIFYDPAYADVKVIQTAIMMETVTKLSEKYARFPPCTDKKRIMFADDKGSTEGLDEATLEPAPSMEYTSTQIPLILCTDLNSTADSGVYELLAQGSIPPDHPDLGKYKYGNFTRDGIEHPFSLRSAYANLDGGPNEVPYTNYTPGFTGVIDYIWYSTNALEVTALLGAPDEEYMKRVPGWPTYHFPSDHLALKADFIVKSRKEKKSHAEPDFGPQRDRRTEPR